jgi:hypothetical protein
MVQNSDANWTYHSAPLLGNDLRPACLPLLLGAYNGVVTAVA